MAILRIQNYDLADHMISLADLSQGNETKEIRAELYLNILLKFEHIEFHNCREEIL